MRTAGTKEKLSFNSLFLLLFFFLLCISFYGCKTAPKKPQFPEVNPLALLSTDSGIYVSVPVQKHQQLTQDLLCAEVQTLSKDDAKKIVERINILYGGVLLSKKGARIELTAEGSFPQIGLNLVLTEKNGWQKSGYTAPSDEQALALEYPNQFDLYARTDTPFKVAFPSENILCTGQNLEPLLNQYALRPTLDEKSEMVKWVSAPSDDILFFITKPGQYLMSLIGQPIPVNCNTVTGRVTPLVAKDGKVSVEKYNLTLTIQIVDPRAMTAMLSMMKLAVGLMDGTVRQIDSMNVEVSNIEISEQQIISLLTHEEIQSKHFAPKKQ